MRQLTALSLRGSDPTQPGRSGRFIAGAAWGCLVLLLAVLTWRRSTIFGDEESIWRDTLAKNPAATIARVDLGILLAKRGAYGEAMELFQTALAVESEAADILTNLGHVYDSLGRTVDAEACYRRALRSDPDFKAAQVGLASLLANARYNLGKVLDDRGDLAKAITLYREALGIKPDFAEAHNNLGVDLAMAGQREEAAAHFREALRLRPEYREAAVNLEALDSGPRLR